MTDGSPAEFSFAELRKRYENGENITKLLMTTPGVNTTDSIEIAYELQAGSYSRWVKENSEAWQRYCDELAEIVSRFLAPESSLLDCGAGELTTLCGVLSKIDPALIAQSFAFDVSLSRLKAGMRFADSCLPPQVMRNMNIFSARMENIPLPDSCIDVVSTSHALEPNGGREIALLTELFRVAKEMVIIFEPSYKDNSVEGRKRMDSLGYVKDLEEAISFCGGELIEKVPVKAHSNPLNPTMGFVVRLNSSAETNDADFVCPKNHDRLIKKNHYLWSGEGMLAYPIFDGIPLLKPDQAVILANP